MSNIVIVGGGFAALQTIKMVRKTRPRYRDHHDHGRFGG